MAEIKYYSKEGLQKLKDELHQMITIERPAISAAIAEARDKGDLSENAEYDAAKEAQGLLEAKIAKLQALIANARLLDETKIDTSKVLLLSKVEFINLALKKTMTYELVPESEANIKVGKLSITNSQRIAWQEGWRHSRNRSSGRHNEAANNENNKRITWHQYSQR